ncbi:MAG TPA: hypothetical protein PLN34_05370 [Alloprevotella sp.]|nr:hypothetical protein [Alloprevotella sp.]
MDKQNIEIGYQFTAIPTNLFLCCDNNVRSMLSTLVQLSSYYANNDGWFFRTNEDLRAESQLSENLVRATLSTLYNIGIVDIKTVGKGKSKTPNQFRLNIDIFKNWEKYSLEDCIKHPDLRIETDDYKAKGWQPSYIKQLDKIESSTIEVPISSPTLSLSEDYTENINNRENALSEGEWYNHVEVKSNHFEAYKKKEDELMDKLYNIKTWIDFKYIRTDIDKLISTASSETIAENTKKRYKKIEEGKIKYFKNKLSKEPYNQYYEDFYQKYDCGWFGKERTKVKHNVVQLKSSNDMENEEDNKEVMRNFYERFGMDVPNEYKAKEVSKDKYAIKVPILNGDGNDDDLPF